MEFYAAERKKELLAFTTAWMELESIMLSEISQAVRDKCPSGLNRKSPEVLKGGISEYSLQPNLS